MRPLTTLRKTARSRKPRPILETDTASIRSCAEDHNATEINQFCTSGCNTHTPTDFLNNVKTDSHKRHAVVGALFTIVILCVLWLCADGIMFRSNASTPMSDIIGHISVLVAEQEGVRIETLKRIDEMHREQKEERRQEISRVEHMALEMQVRLVNMTNTELGAIRGDIHTLEGITESVSKKIEEKDEILKDHDEKLKKIQNEIHSFREYLNNNFKLKEENINILPENSQCVGEEVFDEISDLRRKQENTMIALNKTDEMFAQTLSTLTQAQTTLENTIERIKQLESKENQMQIQTDIDTDITEKIHFLLERLTKLEMTHKDSTGEVDWALSSMGGRVDLGRTSHKMLSVGGKEWGRGGSVGQVVKLFEHTARTILGAPSEHVYDVRWVLDRDISPGRCFPVADGGIITIALKHTMEVTSVAFDHTPIELTVNKDLVPSVISVSSITPAYTQSTTDKHTYIGDFKFSFGTGPSVHPLTTPVVTQMLQFEFTSVGGVFSCVYRIRVHGQPINYAATVAHKS
eukprot:GHVR01161590.1.p1 GENE.GHVR01161590.1~~GHVR01161590.1.p1  ORF type:complete len:520 (+),score=116.92 GHVR01161590.1:108-1667(+)